LQFTELKSSNAAKNRMPEQEKVPFSAVSNRLQEKQFWLMFCMDHECFFALCDTIKHKIGEKEFKSEEYLRKLHHMKMKEGQMYHCNIVASGGYLSGKVKVAVGLRILAGGSYLDVACFFWHSS